MTTDINAAEEDPAVRKVKGEKFARKKTESIFTDSSFTDLSGRLPAFDRDEIKVGRLLGKGSFGAVFEIRAFELNDEQQLNKKNHPSARKFLSEHCLREDGSSEARYAVKRLTQNSVNDPAKYVQAMVDAAIETILLSNIEHPHICKLRAVSASRDPFTEDYVLVLDRLYDTLSSRILVWEGVHKKIKNKTTRWLVDKGGKKMQALRECQLIAAMQLSAALDHLHEHNIVYRDTKPDNVGFDIRDDIKLFDFGLAKELLPGRKMGDDSGMYKLSALTGSPRYMAPEVANGVPYNQNCDSHSFAVLFWEMYSFTCPFDMFTMEQMVKDVWNGQHTRPEVPDKWPEAIKNMLKNSWCPDHSKRWTISQIMKVLHAECSKFNSGRAHQDADVPCDPNPEAPEEDKTTNNLRSAFQRRRSTFIFQEEEDYARSSLGSLVRDPSTKVLDKHHSSIMSSFMSDGNFSIDEDDEDDEDGSSFVDTFCIDDPPPVPVA